MGKKPTVIHLSKPQWMILNGQIVGGLTKHSVDAFTTQYHIAGWHSLSIIPNHSG